MNEINSLFDLLYNLTLTYEALDTLPNLFMQKKASLPLVYAESSDKKKTRLGLHCQTPALSKVYEQ